MSEKKEKVSELLIPKVTHRVLKPVSKNEAFDCVQKLYDTAIISSSEHEVLRKKINRLMLSKVEETEEEKASVKAKKK